MPVLVISPNGSITEKVNLTVAILEHPLQPNPLLNNSNKKVMIVTTDMAQTVTPLLQIPADVEIRFANNAVYTVGSGQTLDLSACEFQRPHYDCFAGSLGNIIYPQAGPVVQDWSVKNIIASAGASIAGALTAASAAFTGTCQAIGGFVGNLTGNVTGTATFADSATGAGTAVKGSQVGVKVWFGSGNTGASNNGTCDYSGAGFAATPSVVCCGAASSGVVFELDTANSSSANCKSFLNNVSQPNMSFYFIAVGK